MSNDNVDIQLINGFDYYAFHVEINNHTIGDPKILSKQGILELCIVEKFDYLTGPTEGYLTIFNGAEALENDDFDPDFKAMKYLLRNDGRDALKIQIKPVDENGDNVLSEDMWMIEYNFIIRDIEDIKSTNNMNKAKRLYFWDENYQKMREKNSVFSTTTNTSYPTQASDEDRKMLTGEAIKKCLKDNDIKDYVYEDEFNKGVFKIFYTSSAQASVYDDLIYLMKYHLSENEQDVCILNYRRDKKQLTLMPLSWYFSKAGNKSDKPGKFQLEHLFFVYDGNASDVGTKMYQSPLNIDITKDINLGSVSSIIAYQFVDMAGFDSSQLIVSHPTHTYDFKNKKFKVFAVNNNIGKFLDIMDTNYTSKLLGRTAAGAYPLITLNKTKTENKAINLEWTPQFDCDYPLYKGLKQLLYSGVFLNECINFWILGSSHRIPGRFYAIDKMDGAKGKLAAKLCGQWLGVEVKHIFARNGVYFNNITAVKCQSFEQLGLKESIE